MSESAEVYNSVVDDCSTFAQLNRRQAPVYKVLALTRDSQ